MISRLTIKNYILINELEVSFSNGLTAITGETGSGKSILLGALKLILGQRADISAVLDKTKKCVIEASFYAKDNESIKSLFETNDLDWDDTELLFRREISANGKSRAFINDTPVSLNILKLIGESLIDIHSQNENILLNNALFQLKIIDRFANNGQLILKYQTLYKTYKQKLNLFNQLKANKGKSESEKDYLQFLFNELEELNYQPNEYNDIENELALLENAEQLKLNFSNAYNTLYEDEQNVLGVLNNLINILNKTANIDEVNVINERLKASKIELEDIAREINDLNESIEYNPEKIEHLNERLDSINRLANKHHLTNPDDLILKKLEIEEKLLAITSDNENFDTLKNELVEIEKKLKDFALQLRANRVKAIPTVENTVAGVLKDLGIPKAIFQIKHNKKEAFDEFGLDVFDFYFSPNPGIAPQNIKNTASGGEISRLMLALKYCLSQKNKFQTLILDEIDTGVSGKIASKMGELMLEMSANGQIICITHLPQVAAKANEHFKVYKEQTNDKTITYLSKLNRDERVNEIAGMLSGEKVTAAAIENAKNLINL
ncbi:MAG: DNA repair protein RecN [Vicingaceae bacterium]